MNKPNDFNIVKEFMKRNYRHFNSAVVVDAAEGYVKHLKKGGKMFVTIAGAMSTAELGISLAEMIRQGKVHAISCTGANLEEDIFNLVAHKHYKRVPHYRDLSPKDELDLLNNKMNRVTDTCIPEEEAMRAIERKLQLIWRDSKGRRFFPHELIFELIKSGAIKNDYQIDPRDSWVVAACENDIRIFVPGWEDSTLGNVFTADVKRGKVPINIIKSGLEYMSELIDWYKETSKKASIGFFQIGGGIAGDFPICVVPLIEQDLLEKVRKWGYFCQISDSVTSYGGYSGAVPNEKITWGKLDITTPKFVIESDATIVAPLIFAYVLAG